MASPSLAHFGSRRRMYAALALILTVSLNACGGSEKTTEESSSPSPTQTVTPTPTLAPEPVRPKGATIVKGNGYSFAMPKGWRNLTGKMKASQPAIDVAVGDWRQHDGFTNNLNVVVTPTQGAVEDSLGKVARQIKASLTKAAPNYQIRKPTSVAGLPAAHLSGIYRAGRQRYWLEQYVVIGEQQTQVISFSVSPDYPRAQRTKLIGDTLASWATRIK